MLYNAMCEAGFPEEAKRYFILKEKELLSTAGAEKLVSEAVEAICTDGAEFLPLLDSLSKRSGISRYTVDMIALLCSAAPMEKRYREHGISRQVYLDTVLDLRNKLEECKKLKGEWGTFVAWWLVGYFRLKRFALGRLQYEVVAQGEKLALNCHIPSGAPLAYEAVIESFQKAYEFFPEVRADGVITVLCNSWILYPPHLTLFSEGGNLRRFAQLFTVTESTPDPKNHSFWLIFYKNYSFEDLAQLRCTTSLQRNLVKYLLNGGSMGYGKGYLLFDGKEVIDRS